MLIKSYYFSNLIHEISYQLVIFILYLQKNQLMNLTIIIYFKTIISKFNKYKDKK